MQLEKGKRGKISAMQWIAGYDLFLFDFDGLLADTEALHFQAYRETCAEYGLDLNWSMPEYGKAAYFHATGLFDALHKAFPQTIDAQMWPEFYAKKKAAFMRLAPKAELMPGVRELLRALNGADKRMCVVTHSSAEMIAPIRASHAILDLIPHWVTRADYSNPKPAPDGYLLAIEQYGRPGDRIIGFEDTLKGASSLIAAQKITPVLINSFIDFEPQESVIFAKSFPKLATILDAAQKKA